MRYHGEVEFEWKGTLYTITHPEGMINISEAWKPETEKWPTIFSTNSRSRVGVSSSMVVCLRFFF